MKRTELERKIEEMEKELIDMKESLTNLPKELTLEEWLEKEFVGLKFKGIRYCLVVKGDCGGYLISEYMTTCCKKEDTITFLNDSDNETKTFSTSNELFKWMAYDDCIEEVKSAAQIPDPSIMLNYPKESKKPTIDINDITEPTEVVYRGERVTVIGRGNKECEHDYVIKGYSNGHNGSIFAYTYFPGYGPGGVDKQFVDAEDLSLIEEEKEYDR